MDARTYTFVGRIRVRARVLIDYQDSVLGIVFEQDRRVIALNARTLAKAALAFKMPVILSTVGVEMGVNGPTIPSLRAALPSVDHFVAGHSLAAFEELVGVITRA